ncbi:family 4A encapsulin nanocompartment shell protein [Thermococcus sp.]|uniref:family 4A encapsulin nanocompartment shell protein n=1 Tax=Thermococcus sp. TaxID=35749 RepID=UPI00260A5835|nr:family 4A encapsulin nanocompartment shell protein [Thermococcus sp.]
MRGELIRVLSLIEEKANELKLEGFNPDVVLVGKEAYEFIKAQVNEEFGGDEEVLELSGLPVRVVDELGKDAVVIDSKAFGYSPAAKRFTVVR